MMVRMLNSYQGQYVHVGDYLKSLHKDKAEWEKLLYEEKQHTKRIAILAHISEIDSRIKQFVDLL